MKKLRAPIPRTALSPTEVAASLGIGLDHFNHYVRPHVRLIRSGRRVLVPVSELERWLADQAEEPIAIQMTKR